MQALQIYCIDLEHHQACDRDLKYLSSVVVPIECHFRYRQRLQVIIRDQKSLNKSETFHVHEISNFFVAECHNSFK